MKSINTIHTTLYRSPNFLKPTSTNRIISAFASTKPNDEDEIPAVPPSFHEPGTEEPILEKLNISRLLPQHRRMLRDEKPYDEPQIWAHTTEKYHRMMFGRYGLASGVDPRICFPTQEDVDLQMERERIEFPHKIPEMMEMNRKVKEEERAKIKKREEDLDKKLAKLDQWKKELNAKIAKKEADARAAKEKKERLVEEVRRHFGFKVDPRDERFKEMLEQKEREDRKKTKEAKRKAKEDKMMAKLQDTAKTIEGKESTDNSTTKEVKESKEE